MVVANVHISVSGNGENFSSKKDSCILLSGKTELSHCHTEVQMCITEVYGSVQRSELSQLSVYFLSAPNPPSIPVQ